MSTVRPQPDEYVSRHINGKRRHFGHWWGERNDQSPIFKAYNQAIQAAEEVEKIKGALASDENLTPQGQLAALRDATLPFFSAKAKFIATALREREKLKATADKALALTDYDTATNMAHHRLIQAFTNLNPKQRASALLPHNLQANPELARALIAENAMVSGVQEDERERIQESLLSEDDMDVLRDVELADKQITAAEKAFGTATQVLAELAEFSESDIAMLEDQTHEPSPPDKTKSLADGGSIKLQTEDATDET